MLLLKMIINAYDSCDWFTSMSKCFFEMFPCDFRDGIETSKVALLVRIHLSSHLKTGFCFNGVSNSWFSSFLADFSEISTRETISDLSDEVQVDVTGNWSLTESSLEDTETRGLIRERNVNQLIESAWTNDGFIENLRAISSSNEEEILLGIHTVHFS